MESHLSDHECAAWLFIFVVLSHLTMISRHCLISLEGSFTNSATRLILRKVDIVDTDLVESAVSNKIKRVDHLLIELLLIDGTLA